ncbi:hypothetical protein ACX3O0_04515 [Homoserinimonas sp. A447]
MDLTNGLILSQAVRDRSTPLRQYLASRYPNTRQLQREFKAQSGGLLVDTSGASASTMGTAMDLLVRLLLNPNDVPVSALSLFPDNKSYVKTVHLLAGVAGHAIREGGNEAVVSRAVWALALCVQTLRAGLLRLPQILDLAPRGKFNPKVMILQATPEAIRELNELRGVAETHLIPHLEKPFHLGPGFESANAGTHGIAAEADLICNGLLLDIKTQLGSLSANSGTRSDSLSAAQLYQLIAYALLDYSDTYEIDRLGLYSARYGSLVVWPLDYVTSTMAGRWVDIRAARQELREML